MFHLQRLKCFKSKYPYLNVFTERSVCDLPKMTEQIRGKAELHAPIALYIYSDLVLTHIIIYYFICFSCYTNSFLSVCCTSCGKLYTVGFWKYSGIQLTYWKFLHSPCIIPLVYGSQFTVFDF